MSLTPGVIFQSKHAAASDIAKNRSLVLERAVFPRNKKGGNAPGAGDNLSEQILSQS